jgi:hypothetical protein
MPRSLPRYLMQALGPSNTEFSGEPAALPSLVRCNDGMDSSCDSIGIDVPPVTAKAESTCTILSSGSISQRLTCN